MATVDTDQDGVGDACDVCPTIQDDQTDSDSDGTADCGASDTLPSAFVYIADEDAE